MNQYNQELGELFQLGFELSHYPFLKDKSWHNYMCPSFIFKAKVNSDKSAYLEQSEKYLFLQIDYLREDE
ncbi:hypothetical protein [Shewanella sp. UCD-KL12]|uniref:hypothetical protein n=1 Tax=Shewanella sp. UCD-KL12 TaxID=1917163 RepID=UPI0009712FC3|nr:hypothetical protein [Shewanella sp. UCD-KL12]